MHWDVIVIGAGGVGSAVAHQLARRGVSVLGLEQYSIPHDLGSSHGGSRIIRHAYFEDPRYVPLTFEAFELWDDLSLEAEELIWTQTGVLNLGSPDHTSIRGAVRSVMEHALPHERLDAQGVAERWPAIQPRPEDVGVFESNGAILFPEKCIQANVTAAQRHGARIRSNEPVLRVDARGDGVQVWTDADTYTAHSLVVCGGPWLAAPDSPIRVTAPLKIERQVQMWFKPKQAELMVPGNLPAFIHFVGDSAYTVVPLKDAPGLKVCLHHREQFVESPSALKRTVTAEDVAPIRNYMEEYLPDANGQLMDAKACMYTNTQDEHFLVGRHPQYERVFIAGGFSGHGFKFAPVIGRGIADLVTQGTTSPELDLFDPCRFTWTWTRTSLA